MRKLRYNFLNEEIDFGEYDVNVLIIESQRVFRDFVQDLQYLYDGENTSLLFTDNYEECRLSNYAQFIRYMNDIDFENKKILSKVQQELHKIAIEEKYIKTSELTSIVETYIQDIVDISNFDLVHDIFDIDIILKSLHIRLNVDDMNFLEKICKYMDFTTNIFMTDIFIFVNLKTYLEKEELLELYNYCKYNKISLLLCENTTREKLDREKIIILDKDLCQI